LTAFSPSGGFFATAQEDGLLRVWREPEGPPLGYEIPFQGTETFIELSGDGRYFLGAGWNLVGDRTSTSVYEVDTAKAVWEDVETGGILNGAAFSPDGQRLVTLSSLETNITVRDANKYRPDKAAGWVRLWDLTKKGQAAEPLRTLSEPMGASYSPDGRIVVVVCANGEILFLNPSNLMPIRQARHGARVMPGLMASKYIPTASIDGCLSRA
jgi:WD40 repeat protein